jgi:phenylacetate-CoA ligase
MERSQWWSRDQIADFQWLELRRLLQHVFRSVPYYREKYAAAGIELGDIKTREHFAQLPPLTREDVNAHKPQLCSDEWKGRLVPHATGGSSGVPTRFFITVDSYDWRCAASARAYSWSGYRTGERALYLWGAPVGKVSPLQRAKIDGYRFFRRELVIPTFVQTDKLWQDAYYSAVRFSPRFVVGYVSSLEQFAKFLQRRKLEIPGIVAVLASAEPVHQSTRDLVWNVFHAPLFNTYGAREFMSIAAECEQHDGLHVHAENLLVESEPIGDELASELLVTDLHNYGMPFIRYRIGDFGSLSDAPCPCGRSLPSIRRVEGRVLEMLRTVDGKVVPGEFFPHLMKEIDEVREYQVQQRSLDEVILSVVLTRPFSENSERLLKQEIARVFTPPTRVRVNPVKAIAHLPSGKRRRTIGIA